MAGEWKAENQVVMKSNCRIFLHNLRWMTEICGGNGGRRLFSLVYTNERYGVGSDSGYTSVPESALSSCIVCWEARAKWRFILQA